MTRQIKAARVAGDESILIIADSSVAFATLGIALLFFFEIQQLWHIYIMLFVRSIGGIFHYTAMQASTSLMVPDEHLSRVAGANNALARDVLLLEHCGQLDPNKPIMPGFIIEAG